MTLFGNGWSSLLIKRNASPGDVSGERVWEGQGRRNAEVLVSDLGSALKIVERTTAIAIDTYDAET